MPSDLQLLESIREHGLLLPVYTHLGVVIDGAKRLAYALQLGKPIKYRAIDDVQSARAFLWSLHPERALQRFCGEGCGHTLSQHVSMYGARPAKMKVAMALLNPPPAREQRRSYDRRRYVRLPEQTDRELRATAGSLRARQQEVIVAALRIAFRAEAQLEAELRALREITRRKPKASKRRSSQAAGHT